MITLSLVDLIHKNILDNEPGLKGATDFGKLEGALSRVDHWILYQNIDDIFDIASLYAVAIAKAHAFSDGNKRTAMVVMITYLLMQGVEIPPDCGLDDVMVEVASGQRDYLSLSHYLKEKAIFS